MYNHLNGWEDFCVAHAEIGKTITPAEPLWVVKIEFMSYEKEGKRGDCWGWSSHRVHAIGLRKEVDPNLKTESALLVMDSWGQANWVNPNLAWQGEDATGLVDRPDRDGYTYLTNVEPTQGTIYVPNIIGKLGIPHEDEVYPDEVGP